MKRFRRKKSESKMKRRNVSVSDIVDMSSEADREAGPSLSPPVTRLSLTSTCKHPLEENLEDAVFSNVSVDNGAKMETRYNEPGMKEERLADVTERLDAVLTLETLVRYCAVSFQIGMFQGNQARPSLSSTCGRFSRFIELPNRKKPSIF